MHFARNDASPSNDLAWSVVFLVHRETLLYRKLLREYDYDLL